MRGRSSGSFAADWTPFSRNRGDCFLTEANLRQQKPRSLGPFSGDVAYLTKLPIHKLIPALNIPRPLDKSPSVGTSQVAFEDYRGSGTVFSSSP